MPSTLTFVSAEEAAAAQDVHQAAAALNRALERAHTLGLWIDLEHEPRGMPTALTSHGGYVEIPGSPPSVTVDVAFRLPPKESPDA